MQEPGQTFSYTALRSAYWTLVGSLGFLFLVEAGLTALLIAVLIHILWLQLLLNSLHTALIVFILIFMLSPLWTKHRLTSTYLHLHYGVPFHQHIPREVISKVEPVLDRKAASLPVSARYDVQAHRITACFSERGQVLIHFKQPQNLKIGRKLHSTTSIVINVDQRDKFLAALAQSSTIQPLI